MHDAVDPELVTSGCSPWRTPRFLNRRLSWLSLSLTATVPQVHWQTQLPSTSTLLSHSMWSARQFGFGFGVLYDHHSYFTRTNSPASRGTHYVQPPDHIYVSFRHVVGKLMDFSHNNHRELIHTDWPQKIPFPKDSSYGLSVWRHIFHRYPSPSPGTQPKFWHASLLTFVHQMADPNISPATPIDIPLERSLYTGNVFRGILLGENFHKPGICLCRLTGSRSGDIHILRSRVLHVTLSLELPKTPKVLHNLWCGSARTCYHPGSLKWPVGTIHVDRPPQPSRRPTRVLCSITGRVVRHHRSGGHRHGEYCRRRASRASHLSIKGSSNVRVTQWLNRTGVPMLHNLGLAMANHRSSGTDIPGLHWCA